MIKKILLQVAVVAISLPAFSVDLLPAESPGFWGNRVRNLGMGNIGVSILGTTESSAFYNPAGLNDITRGEFRFMTTTVSVADDSIGLIKDTKNLVDDLDDANTDAARIRTLNDFINERSGEFQHLRLGLELFSYTRKNFAAGLMIDQKLDMSFRDQSFPHFDMRNLGDAGGYIAFSTGFWDQLLQAGITFKPVMRFALNEDDQRITYADVVTENSKGDPIILDQMENIVDDRQLAIPVDFGMKSNLAFDFWKDSFFIEQLRPQIGFTWEDIGSPSFHPLTAQTQTLNAGFSLNPKLWRIKNTLAVEFRELNRERPLLSKLHLGAEVKLPWILAVRGGLSQGYASGGVTVDLVFFKIDAAVYYQEIGYYTREEGSLRYAASFGFKI